MVAACLPKAFQTERSVTRSPPTRKPLTARSDWQGHLRYWLNTPCAIWLALDFPFSRRIARTSPVARKPIAKVQATCVES